MQNEGANNRKRKLVIDLTDDAPPCVVDLTGTDDVPPAAAPAPAGPSSARDCPVCMDAVGTEGPVTALGCFHIFCRPCIARCITTQLERHRSPDCPVCKRLIPPDEQRACGVDPSPGAGGSAAYGPAIDMFAVDLDGADPPDAARLGLRAAFPHAHGRDLHRDPMLLLDQVRARTGVNYGLGLGLRVRTGAQG